jgi:alpha-1,6-mannosyltransferase
MEKNPHFSTIRYIFTPTLEKPVSIAHDTTNKENAPAYLTKLATLLRSHIWFFLFGTISELIYLFYLLRNFPLTHYFQSAKSDMGSMSGYTHAGFLTFVIVFSFLFVMFGLAWWEAHKYQDRATLWIILSFGAIFALTTIFVYPITALDLFFYVARGLVMVQYHANPMITPPALFPHDPLMKLAGTVINLPSAYGPLTQLIQAVPLLIAGRNVFASVLLFKLMFSAMLILEAFFVYKILSHIAPKFALPGALALAWNPFALLEYSANSHNDIVMTFFIVLAVFAPVEKRHAWAMTFITASALIKFASLPLIPLFFIYSFRQQPTAKARTTYTIKAIVVFFSFMIDGFALFWAGPQTLQRFFDQIQERLYSFNVFLYGFSSGSISLDQSKLIGWAIFGLCFLYALWLSSRDFSSMLKGCFLTMFALLAFGTTFVQPWYFIWPFVFAILIPCIPVSLAAFLFLYGATLTELVHAYIFPWAGSHLQNIIVIASNASYLTIFLPPVLFLLAYRFRQISSQPPSSQKDFDPLSP